MSTTVQPPRHAWEPGGEEEEKPPREGREGREKIASRVGVLASAAVMQMSPTPDAPYQRRLTIMLTCH